jgi:hypothetical protein
MLLCMRNGHSCQTLTTKRRCSEAWLESPAVISCKNLDIHVAVLALTQRAGCYLTTSAGLKEETSWLQGLLQAEKDDGDERCSQVVILVVKVNKVNTRV